FSTTTLAFSAMGADRMAEFNPEHVPAFTEGRKPRKWLCFYPFVRSYDWYTMEASERARLLRSHGKLGQEFPDVWANTVSAFGLNDWEWLLGLESPRLELLVDMMRSLRNNETRHYVREEIPFYTGHTLRSMKSQRCWPNGLPYWNPRLRIGHHANPMGGRCNVHTRDHLSAVRDENRRGDNHRVTGNVGWHRRVCHSAASSRYRRRRRHGGALA